MGEGTGRVGGGDWAGGGGGGGGEGNFGKECVEFISCSVGLGASEETQPWPRAERTQGSGQREGTLNSSPLLPGSACPQQEARGGGGGGEEGHGRATAEEDLLQAEGQRQITQEDRGQTER